MICCESKYEYLGPELQVESTLKKGSLNDEEFEEFLTDIAPSLDQSVGRLGVAGHVSSGPDAIDAAKLITIWPEIVDRVIEELR